jgi:hypothetical protein
MKNRVATLEGALLDAAVALASGHIPQIIDGCCWVCIKRADGNLQARWTYVPSACWRSGGEIIERERITVIWDGSANEPAWNAYAFACLGDLNRYQRGHTPLVAAMRAYVASKFGDEVELPC